MASRRSWLQAGCCPLCSCFGSDEWRGGGLAPEGTPRSKARARGFGNPKPDGRSLMRVRGVPAQTHAVCRGLVFYLLTVCGMPLIGGSSVIMSLVLHVTIASALENLGCTCTKCFPATSDPDGAVNQCHFPWQARLSPLSQHYLKFLREWQKEPRERKFYWAPPTQAFGAANSWVGCCLLPGLSLRWLSFPDEFSDQCSRGNKPDICDQARQLVVLPN
jgi:hypothetical protein